MKRKLIWVLLPLLLTGCWDYKDINKLSIVTGMAFEDADSGEILISLEIVDRSSGPNDEGLRTRVVKTEGENVDDAIGKLSKGLDFELYYGAMAVVIFSGDEPRPEILEWLLKNREVRETVYVLFEEKAGELLQSEEDGGIAAYKLRDILDASEESSPLELYKVEGAIK
jgi:spore germination protein KC